MKSLLIALSTYSALPTPGGEWREGDMGLALCWLPLVGLLIGGAQLLWLLLAQALAWGGLLTAIGTVLLPLLVSGGIHMDGFCDAVDALSSHQPPAKKREILHDPRAGAFAIMGCCGYLLLHLGLMGELLRRAEGLFGQTWQLALALTACCLLSRAGCCLQVADLPRYSDRGMLAAFALPMRRRAVRVAAWLWLGLGLGLLLWLSPWYAGAAALLLSLFTPVFRFTVKVRFQGMSGDLAGFYVQTAELLGLLALLLGAAAGGML